MKTDHPLLRLALLRVAFAVATLLAMAGSAAAQMEETNPRRADEGDGPHERLILRGATYIDGAGAPPRGPVDIVIENDRIVEIRSVGFPMATINAPSSRTSFFLSMAVKPPRDGPRWLAGRYG